MVICYEAVEKDGALVLHSSRDEYSTSGIASQLNLLLNQYSDRQEDVDRFAWNLDETITPILRNLVPAQAEKLWTTHECTVKVRDETFSLWYMPEKLLRVSRYKHGKQEVASLYFLGQFFPDDLESPIDITACVGYAQLLIKRLEAKGIRSHRFTSPIALFATDQLESLQLPRVYFDKDKRVSVNDTGVPIQALKYAARYGGRLWIEAHQLGLQHVWHYDLRCYSEDTEVLSHTGWKRITELHVGEPILSFCTVDEKCRFEPVLALHTYPYQGEMVSIHNRHMDMLVTPNHRVLLKPHERCTNSKWLRNNGKHGYNNKWQVYEAGSMPNGNVRIPISFPMADREDYPIKDEMLQVMAWVITEGHQGKVPLKGKDGKYNCGVYIGQSQTVHPQYCQEIEHCLSTLGLVYTDHLEDKTYKHKNTTKTYQMRHWRICKISEPLLRLDPDNLHLIPLWIIQQCSKRQLQLFLETLLKGDGTKTPKKTCFYTNLKENADRVMWIAQLLGYKSTIYIRAGWWKETSRYHVCINDHLHIPRNNTHCVDVNYGKVKRLPYEGTVSCPTVADGFIVVRRNGKVFISGNSAFSKCASTLQDTRECQWVNCKGIPKDAVFGTGLARKTVTSRLSPIIMPRDHKVDISPKGTWEDVFMLPEIDWIKKHGKIEIIDGWWGIPKRVKQPLNFIYNKVAPWRGEDRFWDAIAKRMLNGIYGLTLQQYDNGRFGDFWNGMWGSTIDATVAVHVANTIEKYAVQDYVTQIGVDSFSTSHQVLMTDQDLVDWKLSHEGEQLVISSGLIYEAQKKPHGWTLEELSQIMHDNPDSYRYSKQYTRRLTLGDAVQKNRYIDIGRIIEVDASVDLSGEHDRIFEDGGPRTGRELLDHVWTSEPIEVKE